MLEKCYLTQCIICSFGSGVGFATKAKQESQSENLKSVLEKELKKKFAPEFINRLDEIIYFKDLEKDDISKIVDLELNKTLLRAKDIGYELNITDTLKEHLISVGYDKDYGARPLKRAIQKWVDDFVTEYILEKELKPGTSLELSYDSESDVTVINLKTIKGKKERKKKE